MSKLYKLVENRGLHYKEMWFDNQRGVIVIHSGKVGYIGKSEEIAIKVEDVEKYSERFVSECNQQGYMNLNDDDLYRLVIQYPLKSEFGNKRDAWLKDKVQEYVQNHLGWYGLGHVDGFDIGNKKLNIFCIVVNEEKAVSSIKTCLKTYRLDFTNVRIATKKMNDNEYRLKYSYKFIEKFELI